MSSLNTIAFSLLGGVLPALLWLWFWLKEDRLHPEPKLGVILVFISGMISVFLVLPIEKYIFNVLSSISLSTIILWAAIEEVTKYLFAYIIILRNKVVDEPIDAIIYMITIALGFSALENTLFISNLVDSGQVSQSIITGNSRFLGATLLHVASSAAVGVMMGLSFYRKNKAKIGYVLTGLLFAITLHTAFNLFIINLQNNLFLVFTGIWILIVLLIVLIQKVKKVNPKF